MSGLVEKVEQSGKFRKWQHYAIEQPRIDDSNALLGYNDIITI